MVSIKQLAILGFALGSPIAVASPGDIEKRSSELNPDALPSKLKRSEGGYCDETVPYFDDCEKLVDEDAEKRSSELNPDALLKRGEECEGCFPDGPPPPYDRRLEIRR